jgi:hypothetical protein
MGDAKRTSIPTNKSTARMSNGDSNSIGERITPEIVHMINKGIEEEKNTRELLLRNTLFFEHALLFRIKIYRML